MMTGVMMTGVMMTGVMMTGVMMRMVVGMGGGGGWVSLINTN